MKLQRRRSSVKKGFTLVEVIIDAFVITVIFGAVIGGFLVMLRATDSGKNRTVANALANEQMEYLRNLPYDSLATQNGTILPQGTIPDTQTVSKGGITLTLNTTIVFIDDNFDGCAIALGGGLYQCTDGTTSSVNDTVPVDYKRINVEALKTGTPNVLIKLSSNVAAKAAETPSNTGMILVKVIDAQGLPVSQAIVDLTNTATFVTMQGITNLQGYLFVANLPPDSHNGYHIVVTKNGYSSDYTTYRTAQNPNQTQPDVDVNVQQVTVQTFAIDLLSSMSVTLKNELGQPLPSILLTATSSKTIYNNPTTAKNVYTATTDGSGVASFNLIEWDSYSLSTPSGYYVVTTSPYAPVAVSPNSSLPVIFVITTNSSWPSINSVSPISALVGTTVVFEIEGSNFTGNSTVNLKLSGQPDLTPTVIDVQPNQKSITVTFDLTGVNPGNWDIFVNSNGQTATQVEGFTIT